MVYSQGFKAMSPPTKELMKLTLEEKLAHDGHPVLLFMTTEASNAIEGIVTTSTRYCIVI